MHTLISDGGSMTVGRRTANYTWGAFEVTLREGLEQAEQLDDRLQDGYIYRPDDRGHGRAELTFVRADARIDMNAAKSDLEQTLDGASERTKGEAYYTRQISGVGLGKARLGVDVRQGDMVRVLLWSKYLELPVTAIIPGKSVDGSTPVMAAQVGGQMLRDAELLSKRNSEIDTAIAVEKRTRLNQVGAVDKKATQAKDTADTAKGAAEAADGKAEQAKGGAVEVDESTTESLEAETANILSQIQAQQDELAKSLSGSVNVIMATAAGTSFPGVETRPSSEGYDWEFTIPDTRGALAKIEFWDMSSVPATHVSTQIGVVDSAGQRIRTTAGMFVQVTWSKPSAVQRTISQLITAAFTPAQTTWTTVQNLVVSPGNDASQGYLTARVVWNAANRGSTYGVRFLVDGVERGRFLSSKIGPLSFLEDGERGQKTSATNLDVPAGKNIIVQVYSTADNSSARRVKSVELTGTWIETAG